MRFRVRFRGAERALAGEGNGPIAAFADALGREIGRRVEVTDYVEHALGSGAEARAAAYVEASVGGGPRRWGAASDGNIVTASLRALAGAVGRDFGASGATTGETESRARRLNPVKA
jgi:2-isopropylmalate synthase